MLFADAAQCSRSTTRETFQELGVQHLLDEIHKRADMNRVINPVDVHAGAMK